MISEIGDIKKVWIQRHCIEKITHFRINCRAFLLCVDWSRDVGRKLQVVHKRKLTSKSITKKYKIFKEVDKDSSCVLVAKKNNIPKQTLSNWLKKKKQIHESVDANSSTMTKQRFRGSPNKNLDEASHKWLVNAWGQNIPISATMSKQKSSLQRSWDAMISGHQMVGWTDGRRGKAFLLRQF